jgi:plastocyanin
VRITGGTFLAIYRRAVRHTCSILLLATGLAVGSVQAQVVIEGTVTLPKPSYDRGLNQRYNASPDVALAPTNPPAAVVYLEGDFRAAAASASKSPGQVAQKNIAFAPDLLPVLVGTAVEFPNMDDTYHNVFSYSKTKRFDLGRYRKDEKPTTVVFDKPGAVTIHCEIHERMRGTILVLETPYFQKTDTTGKYHLEHLPAGSYTLRAWVAGDDIRQRPVELKTGMTLHVDFPAK